MLNWMFQHDCFEHLLFLSVLYACVFYFCICTCSAQLSMFHKEKRSRNTLIIIMIMIMMMMMMMIMIIVVVVVIIIIIIIDIIIIIIRLVPALTLYCRHLAGWPLECYYCHWYVSTGKRGKQSQISRFGRGASNLRYHAWEEGQAV